MQSAENITLPKSLKPLFWEHDFARLSWKNSRNLILTKVLAHGTWEQVKWLRSAAGDDMLRAWIISTQGRRLSPRQLSYWQLALDIPRKDVRAWLASPARHIWDRRTRNGRAS